MERRDVTSAVAQNVHLRGLMGVPLGLLSVVAALGNWSWGPLRHAWVFGVCVLALAGIAYLIARYYDDRYGRSTPSPRRQRRTLLAAAATVPVVYGGSLLLSSRASWSLDLPVNPVAISLAAVTLAFYAANVGLRAHHVVVLGALLTAGLIPVWEPAGRGDAANVGLLLFGLATLAVGILDHRLLVRSLGPPRLDADARIGS